jgi:hypothetical protein
VTDKNVSEAVASIAVVEVGPQTLVVRCTNLVHYQQSPYPRDGICRHYLQETTEVTTKTSKRRRKKKKRKKEVRDRDGNSY